MPLFPGFVSLILENESNPVRLEEFAIELLSHAEGETFLPTSRTYDQGRDGRALRAQPEGEPILLATTARKLEPKAERDVAHLARTTRLKSLTYCTTAHNTEAALDKVEARLRQLVPPTVSVRMLGVTQLAALCLRDEAVFTKYYGPEYETLKAPLVTEPTANDSPDVIGFRLALKTQTGDDAIALRLEVCRRLVLEQLYWEGPLTQGNLCARIAARLHLPRSISPAFLAPAVERLIAEGLLEDVPDGRLALTEHGKDTAVEVDPSAAAKLLEGRTAIRRTIAELLGHDLAEADFSRFWAAFQDSIAAMFYSHGAAIVEMMASVANADATTPRLSPPAAPRDLANRTCLVFEDAEQRDEVRQAVLDLFTRKDTPAFQWLTAVCAVFVMMCALGLEAQSAEALGSTLRGITLLPDTDILISLLCSGEANHLEVSKILLAWRAMGGKVEAPVPALEEVAYHAWIADSDYLAVADMLRSLSDERASYLVSNAFVRTFRATARGHVGIREWRAFIDDFRGTTQHDFSSVLEILAADLHVPAFQDLAPALNMEPESFFARVRARLQEQLAVDIGCTVDALDYRALDKIKRDALLLATVQLARTRLGSTGSSNTVIAISSARSLRRADDAFRADLGRPSAVLSVAAVAALLALTPGVAMGVAAMRAVLFDVGLAKRLTPSQLFVYRITNRTDQYAVPLGRRAILARRFRERVVDDARKRGIPATQMEREILSGSDPATSAEAVKAALDRLAVPSKAAETIAAQARMIAELQAELDQIRRAQS